MGVNTKKIPLPAPTDESTLSSTDRTRMGPDDLATDISRMTDKTSYSVPEDGSPITISTKKIRSTGDGSLRKGTHPSQTSLLIEYFEGGREGDKPKSRPSVRVKVTPSSARKASSGSDHIQITETGKNRKPSYTRRISLGGKNYGEKLQLGVPEGTEVSYSDESNLSGRPPVEVEVLHNGSDLSTSHVMREHPAMMAASDISSMPPDSMLEGGGNPPAAQRRRSRSVERTVEQSDDGTLKAPSRRRSRSLSRERIKKRVMQELAERPKDSSSKHKRHSDRSSKDYSRHRSSRHSKEDEPYSGAESSLLSANASALSGSQQSFRSGTSGSSITNPKLLHTVEDAIRRLILPELNALKEEQKTERNRQRFDRGARDSYASGSSVPREEPQRRLSKSSSAPNVTKKPKVVLNRDEDGSGVTLSLGDSIRSKRTRRSSRESTSEKSLNSRDTQDTAIRDDKVHRKRSKDSHRVRDAAAAGIAGGILTAAALKHHNSRSSVDSRGKKRRSKSRTRSRSHSITESLEEERLKDDVPPLPMRSEIAGSELTRESILSAETQRPDSMDSAGMEPAIREVSRGSVKDAMSPTTQTPTRTPTRTPVSVRHSLGTRQSSHSQEDVRTRETESPRRKSSKTKAAGLAAAGIGGALVAKHKYDKHTGEPELMSEEEMSARKPPRAVSPVQSEVSYSKGEDERLDLQDGGIPARQSITNLSAHSAASSVDNTLARLRQRPQGVNLEKEYQVLGEASPRTNPPGTQTPTKEDYDDWYDRQHEENERIRRSFDSPSHRDSSLVDYKHMTNYTDDSLDAPHLDGVTAEQDVRELGANPGYVHTPVAVESAVASLHDPSSISVRSSQSGPLLKRDGRSNQDLIRDDLQQDFADDQMTPTAEDRHSPSKDRWAALRDHARTISGKSTDSVEWNTGPKDLQMGATHIPDINDPMPEIGHGLEAESDINTNPSIIQGPISGEYGAGESWMYDESRSPAQNSTPVRHHDATEMPIHRGKASLLPAAAAAGAGAALLRHELSRSDKDRDNRSVEQQPYVEDDQSEVHENIGQDPYTPNNYAPSPGQARDRDEGYVSAAHARSPGFTPEPYPKDEDAYAGMDDGMSVDDPFTASRHNRHASGNSHGMASPLYDAATGKGIDSIKSKDVVALMDHLTVRDAQRNARDTEILVTLVRSAADMRNSFEEMKKFIAEQDRKIMENTDKDADYTVQKVLGGPRPQPLGSPRVPRRATDDSEDVQTKRKNIFRRALKGLGSKSTNDLSRIEDMLMHLLDDVETLKSNQNSVAPRSMPSENRLSSYENLRSAPDPGYEPEGQAGTGSTATNSGYLSTHNSRERNMHSGYDGRRGSEHRISTVMEGDEDIDEREAEMFDDGFENTERMLTPTQEAQAVTGSAYDSPSRPQRFQGVQSNENTPRTEKKSSKHQSNTSSLFGIPRISRWSKTTTSSMPDNYRESGQTNRPQSEASRSGSNVNVASPYTDQYEAHLDDRMQSQNSLNNNDPAAEEHYQQQQQRPPSPLIPQEGDAMYEDYLEMDDPKYQAHRNSLNLQHPQPRAGQTSRHQTQLESQAFAFLGNSKSPDADLLGSNPSLSLARNRLSGGGAMPNMSPVQSDGGSSRDSYSASPRQSRLRDDGPLIPQQQQQQQNYNSTPQRPPKISIQDNNNSYSSRPYYSSPLGSGTLLEPIEEVRYSLESEGLSGAVTSSNRYPIVELGADVSGVQQQRLSPDPSASPAGKKMQSPQRKITGPRPMGSRSPGSKQSPRAEGSEALGTVKRKPVQKSRESFQSGESETF